MSEENKKKARHFYEEVLNRKNMAAFDELCAPGIVDHTAMPGQAPGVEGLKQSFQEFMEAFPDLHCEIHEMIGERDLVACHFTLTGTHKGPLMGAAPTGKRVTFHSIDLVRIKDGKATEVWHYGDEMIALAQLGVKLPG